MDQEDDHQTVDGDIEGDALPADSQDTPDVAALLAEKTRECDDAKDRHLRLYAEFENYKKRTQRDQMDYVKYAAEKVLKELLPVADNLERAIAHARSVRADQTILDGLDLIGRQFRDALQKSGAEPIAALGRPFDPAVHQALAQVESTEHEPDTVVEEAQRGYLLHGRILRPALVTVARRPAGD